MTESATARPGGLLGLSEELQERYQAQARPGAQKASGQVFTPPAVARFMASLLPNPASELRLLDPGAGLGALSAAVCERLLKLRSPRRVEIHAFEKDAGLIPLLETNLKHCSRALEAAGHRASFRIHDGDFLQTLDGRDQRSLFGGGGLPRFDAAIMNPPYFKVGGASPHARAWREIVHGQPNIYALFMAQVADLLRPDGTLVAITPRSFCNGLYFREFRRWYFARMALDRIHLFESRRDTFDGVLQESVITATRRLGALPETIGTSAGSVRGLAAPARPTRLPVRDVLDDSSGDMVVRIPASPEEGAVVEAVDAWPHRFRDVGLRISTGPVVFFRARQFARNGMTRSTVPLVSVHNVRAFETVWPSEKNRNGKPDAFEVSSESMPLLLPTRNYVLLRRFTAKEERRRLVASPLLREDLPGAYRAVENHLNYVHLSRRELSPDETLGVAAVLNSVLFDRYFRVFSGNTQVNATEVRTMRFPDLAVVARIGHRVRRYRALPDPRAERAVLSELGVDRALSERLLEKGCTPTPLGGGLEVGALAFRAVPGGRRAQRVHRDHREGR